MSNDPDSAHMEMSNSNGFWEPSLEIEMPSPLLEKICPGIYQEVESTDGDTVWGDAKISCVAFSTDERERYQGSSGGVITAIAIYALETGLVDAVLHVGASEDDPIKTSLRVSRSRSEVLSACSSRYAPAITFPNWFWNLADTNQRYLYIGKPCDIGAIRNIQRIKPEWKDAIPLTIAIFCAGMPSELGTRNILEKLQLGESLSLIRYRGHGWPGRFVARGVGGQEKSISYEESWGYNLNRYLHSRCKICPDGMGLQADIAVGDAWETDTGYPDFAERDGKSLLIIRKINAVNIIEAMINDKRLQVERRINFSVISRMQPYQYIKKLYMFYRLLGIRLTFKKIPTYKGFRLYFSIFKVNPVKGMRQAYGAWRRALFNYS